MSGAAARVPAGTLAAVLVGGPLALVGTYWDEAWHTDVGRDSFFSECQVVLAPP